MVRRKNIVLFSAIVTMLFLSLTFAGAESLEKTVTVKSSYGDSGIDGVKVMIYPLPLGDEIFDGEETVIEVFPLEKCEVFDSTVNCFKPLTTIDVCTTEDGKCTFEKTVNAWQPDISWFLSTSDCEEIASESECRMNWGRCMWDITDWELWWGNVENPTTEQQKCIPGWGYEILPDECFMCKGRIAQAYDIWNALKYKDIAIDFERHPLYNDVGVGEFTTQYEIDAANAHYCIKAIDENGDAIPNALVRLAFYRGAWKDPSTWDDPTQNSFYDGKDTPGISGEYSSHTRRWYIPEYHAIWQETFDYFVPSVYRESNLDIPYERFKVESTRWHHEVDWYDGHYVAFRSDENGELDLPINLPFCSNANYEKNQHGPKDQKIFYERRVYMQYPANPSLNHYETKLKEMRLGDYNPEFCFRKARAQVINIEYASYEPLSTDNLPESAIVPLSGFEDVAFSVVPCDEEYNEIGITGSCTIEDIYDVSNSKPEYTDSIEIEFRDNKGGHIEHSYVADINAKLIYQCPTGEEIVIVNSIDPRTATTFIIDNIRSGLTSGISPMDFKLRVYYTPNDEEEMVEYDYISPYPTVTQVGGPSTVPIKNIIILETFDCSSLCLTEQPDRIGFARERDDTFWKQFLDEWNCPDLETDDEANADFIKEAFKEYIQNPEYEQERMICNFRLDIEGSDDSPKYTIKMKAVNRGVSDPLFILRGGNKPYIFQQMLSEYPLNSVYLNFGKWVKGNT